MCGICGIFQNNQRKVDERLLSEMNDTMIHRGPDGAGIFKGPFCGLGHRRLSIIDLSTGDQPMANGDGTIQVVFNGEIYNFLELRKHLQAKGHVFKTNSDTEVIVHGYAEWEESFVDKLRGMFAIAIWESRQRKLVLARDRLGKKPLYYFYDGRRLLFASEMKALLKDDKIPRQLNLEALDAYLSFGYVPSPLSIFKSIKKLAPGHIAVCTPEKLTIRCYWNLKAVADQGFECNSGTVQKLADIFDESVRLRLVSDVPLGAFLSGGVDSSAVVASMSRSLGGDPVKTAAIGFSEEKYDELEYARLVARFYNTDHSEYTVTPDAVEILEKLVWHFDEPFADASAIPTYYVSQMARRKVTVALSGDGGDEVFAGYAQRYFMNRIEDSIRRRLPVEFRERILRPFSAAYPKAANLPRALRLKNFLHNISLPIEQAFFRDMSFYFLPEMKRMLYRKDVEKSVKDFDALSFLSKHFAQMTNTDAVSQIQYVDIKTYLPEDILVKVDRMSMANSLEVRSPILDHELIEFVARIPSIYKLKGRESKYIFKKMNEDRLPNKVLYRKKQGFCVPLASWFRNELRGFVHDTILSSQARCLNFFEGDYINDLWKRHDTGREDCSTPLWGLMMFELWHRQYLT